MGCCNARNLLVVSGIMLGLAYYLHTPFPTKVSNPLSKSAFGAFFRTCRVVIRFLSFLGYGSEAKLFQILSRKDPGVGSNDQVEIQEAFMDGIRVLIFRPRQKTTTLRAGLIYYHGGGFIMHSPESMSSLCRDLCERTSSVIISPDYRLAPDHVFPAAYEDCVKATTFILRHSREYGVDPDRIGVIGDSAGGNLAMATALTLASFGGSDGTEPLPRLRLQCLIFPSLQVFDFNTSSYIIHGDGPGFLRKNVMLEFYLYYIFGNTSKYDIFSANLHTTVEMKRSKYASYLSRELLPKEFQDEQLEVQQHRSRDIGLDSKYKEFAKEMAGVILDPRLSPLLASDDDIAKLPETYLMIPEYDVLRDDGLLAAGRLQKNKVPTTVDYLPEEEHGFINAMNAPSTQVIFKRFAEFFIKTMNPL